MEAHFSDKYSEGVQFEFFVADEMLNTNWIGVDEIWHDIGDAANNFSMGWHILIKYLVICVTYLILLINTQFTLHFKTYNSTEVEITWHITSG